MPTNDNQMGADAWIWSPACVAWHPWHPWHPCYLGHGPPPPPFVREPPGLEREEANPILQQPVEEAVSHPEILKEIEEELKGKLGNRDARDQFVRQAILSSVSRTPGGDLCWTQMNRELFLEEVYRSLPSCRNKGDQNLLSQILLAYAKFKKLHHQGFESNREKKKREWKQRLNSSRKDRKD